MAFGSVDGAISGAVNDPQGIALPGAQVQLLSSDGKVLKETTTSATGEYQFFPVTFGDYEVKVTAAGLPAYQTSAHVSSDATTRVDAQLAAKNKEMLVEVKAKKRLIHRSSAVSATEVNQKQIQQLPQGDEISLPKLITNTTPGTVQGPFGQVFFRGNHANIQYQIDGVQLPDSPSNTFGEAFSPRNIDHMEIITGGIPAEYGERLAAVVNIVTKTGAEEPGGKAEVSYGSYNTLTPEVSYGGSNASGSLHYYFSAGYMQTSRGLDTPQPLSESNQGQGGKDAIHDQAWSNSEFGKVDWLVNNDNKVSFIVFNSWSKYQIPNYPCNGFNSTDPFFSTVGFTDQFGNTQASNPTFNWVPCNTDDWQRESNTYGQVVWKRTISDTTFLQVAPYVKYSSIFVHNDPTNDLASSSGGATPIANSSPSSFFENRTVGNYGLKADLSNRLDDNNLLKMGFQLQDSFSYGGISVQTNLNTAAVTDQSPDAGYTESFYAQDDYTISKRWVLNAGLRFDATQFYFSGDTHPSDDYLQPRIGVNFMATDTTKLHAFYGRLFQPAPLENLRDTFVNSGAGQLSTYDIKAEKDDYFEIGAAQQLGEEHVLSLNTYYKSAKNMLDDAQLLNTSIAQPFNFAKGYAYGVEASLKGQLSDEFSDYVNYTYEIAKGAGISGGIFAFPVNQLPASTYQFLDHVQVHTANGGIMYLKNHFSAGINALYGSGLRTGPNNSGHVPGHLTFDLTGGYEFKGAGWWERWKVSGDILNILDDVYPITVANGFNGSHYAAGREFFIRVAKDL